MTPVTRDIDPLLAQDLLERVPRACLSFACKHGPQVLPVGVLWQNERCLVGIERDAADHPDLNQEVVLLIDEGIYYFDLRAIYIRGHVRPAETPASSREDVTWYELVPLKTVAWDYGSMREVNSADEH